MNDHTGDDEMEESLLQREVEDFPKLVPGSGEGVCKKTPETIFMQSSSGGIPVVKEKVLVSSDMEAIETNTVHKAARPVFQITKSERDELLALRRRMLSLEVNMEKKGFSIAIFEKANANKEGLFNEGLSMNTGVRTERDEFGLLVF